MVHTECVTEAFSTTCAVHIEDCEGWWLSGCCGSVAAQARGVLDSTPGDCRLANRENREEKDFICRRV